MRHTGITNYLDHGSELAKAQQMAGHASMKTTKIYYDRRDQRLTLSEIERMRF